MDLDQLDDKTLVNKVKEEANEEAFNILLRKHSGIFYKTLHSYMPPSYNETDKRITLEEKPTFFFEAIHTFNEEKNVEFITWLVNKTKFSLLTKRSEEAKKPKIYGDSHYFKKRFDPTENGNEGFNLSYQDRLDEDYYCDNNNFFTMEEDEFEHIANLISKRFGEEMKNIFLERYLENNKYGKSFEEIGKKYSLSHQAVKDKHKKIIDFLKTVPLR